MKITEIYNSINKEIEKRNIRQKDLAKIIGVKPPSLNTFLKGKKSIKLKNLQKILDFLEIEIELKTKKKGA